MKRNTRILIACILAAATAFVSLPGFAAYDNTSGPWTYTVEGDGVTITGYTGPGGDVVLPDTLGGKTVNAIGPRVFEGKAVKTVMLPGGLLGIGEYAFAGCKGLTAITVPKWVSNISARAFEGCSSLVGVYFEGQPPAISATAFDGTPAALLLYGHATQTGWSNYGDRPTKAYCTATLEQLDGTVPAKTALALSSGKIEAPPADPKRAGYQFGGWYREAACLNKWNFSADRIGNDVVLYAKWTPVSCKVTFDSQGGSAVAPVSAPYGSLLPAPSRPARQGSFFGGWYRDAACTVAWSTMTDTLQGDITLYARWLTPTVPADPKAQSSSASSIAVGWKPSANTSGYEVYRAPSAGGEFALVATVYSNTYADHGLSLGVVYFYKVKAFKQLETSRVYSTESVIVSAKPVPVAPAGLKTEWRDARRVKVTWGAVKRADGYELWRAETAAGPYKLVRTTAGRSFTNGRLAVGTDYYYKVRAYVVMKGKKIYSPFSTVTKAQAAPVG